MSPLILIVVIAVILFVTVAAILSRYKRCPSDKVMVIYGNTGKNKGGGNSTARCVHGGAAFIWPVFQDYAFLDLKPMSIEANLTNALSKQNIRVDVPCRFTIGISTDPEVMSNAAERLLGLPTPQIQELVKDLLFGQLRLVIATMDIEEINSDRDKFLTNVANNVDNEIKKIGLKLINVNVTDLRDESGYIEALGKEAAAKAINEAKKSVAEQERYGEIGKAEADRDKDIKIAETQRDRDTNIANAVKDREVLIAIAKRDESIGRAEASRDTNIKIAETERDTRIKIASNNATAVEGENTSKITIANSDALRREKEAEANRIAIAAEKVQQARALEEAYTAERNAELARADKERASQKANIVVPAEIDKEKMIIDAEAEAEKVRREAKGQADAIFAKMDAEAKGLYEILSKQAEGYQQIVDAAGGDPKQAVMFLIADKLPELVKTQVEAVKNIKIDKITVWDGQGGNSNGKTSTANFISGMMQSIPPLNDLFNMAGMELPNYLKGKGNSENSSSTIAVEKEEDHEKSNKKKD